MKITVTNNNQIGKVTFGKVTRVGSIFANDIVDIGNTIFDQINAAYLQANSAYDNANTRVLRIGDTMTGNLNIAATTITQNVIPSSNVTYTLGSPTRRYKDLYLSGNSIYIGDSIISSSGDEIRANTLNAAVSVLVQGENLLVKTNNAYAQANAAYDTANTKLPIVGGSISGDLTITGNLIVSGNSTTLNTETLVVEDAEIVLLSNVINVPVLNAGIIINRGSSPNTFLRWNEPLNKWGWSDNGTIFYSFDTALLAYNQSNGAFTQANFARSTANEAFNQANTARITANDAYAQANTGRATANDAYAQANTARTTANNSYTQANNAYNQANGAFTQANFARTTANDAYIHANTAYDQANTAYGQANDAYFQANTARDTANGAYAQANGAYGQANGAYAQANGAYAQANLAFAQANGAYAQANGAYGQANLAFAQANGAYAHANIVYAQANAARSQANSAYNEANVKLNIAGGNITGTLNVTAGLSVSGNANIYETLYVNTSITTGGSGGDITGVNTIYASTLSSNGINVTAQAANAYDQANNARTQANTARDTANGAYAQANGAYAQANGAYAHANIVYAQANVARTTANDAYAQANVARTTANDAYAQANVARTTANDSYAQANTARDTANDAYLQANTGYDQANVARTTANDAYAQANAGYAQANTARDTANDAYLQANTARTTANDAYGQANAGYAQANAAYGQANAAYAEANLKLNLTGGTISGDLTVSGNLYLSQNTTLINVSTYQVEDPLIYLASNNEISDTVDIGFIGGKNTGGQYSHTGLVRHAGDQKYYLFDGLADEAHQNNVINVSALYLATLKANIEANSILLVGNAVSTQANLTLAHDQANVARTTANDAYAQANVGRTTANDAYAQANVARTTANDAYAQANVGYDQANTARDTANGAYAQANGAYAQANGAYAQANGAYGQANTGIETANGAYAQANGAYAQANGAYAQANVAYGQANDAYFQANTARATANDAYLQANTARTTANDAYGQANAGYAQANTARDTANDAYLQANTARTTANDAYAQANTGRTTANDAYAQANAAYNDSNTRVLRAGDTMTGDLNVAALITTQNVLPNLNVTYNIGSNDKRYNTVYGNTIWVGDAELTSNGATIKVSGVEIQGSNVIVDISASYNQANAARAQANAARDTANGAYSQANGAYAQANGAYEQANGAYLQANGAYGQANLAFAQANGAYAHANIVYLQANTARNTANAAYNEANAAFNQANVARTTANDAYAQANTARDTANDSYAQANTARDTANDSYGQANTARNVANAAYFQANSARNVANSSYSQANLAYAQANAAYDEANLKLNLTGGTVTGDLTVTGNLYLSQNTTFINVSTYSVEDSLIYLASNNDFSDALDIGFIGGKNTSGQYSHTGLVRHAADQKYYLFDNLPDEAHLNNVINVSNLTLATLKANIEANSITLAGNVVGTQANVTLAYNQANSARSQANTAYAQANVARATANDAYNQANVAVATANDSYAQANVARATANGAYGQANTALDTANGAYTQANTARGVANLAYAQANTARDTANDAYAVANTANINAIGAYVQANVARDTANSAYAEANTAHNKANGAYAQANGAYAQANGAYAQANGAYAQANLAFAQANGAYAQANGAYAHANIVYAQANAAYDEANLKLNIAGGTINGSLNVSGNLTVSGNTYYVNVSTYQVDDPLIYLAANNDTSDVVDIGFMGGHNTSGVYQHSGLVRDAGDGTWYLFTGLSEEGHENNVVDFANTTLATLRANISANSITLMGNAVATNVQVNTAYAQANAAYAQANLAYDAANNAQVTIYANNASNVTTQNINFVNTSSIAVTVTADGSNANIAFSSLGGGVVNTVIKTVTYTSANAAGNLTYNLPISPAGVPYIFVIKNGITLTPNTDYSLAGNTLTVIESGSANDTIEVRYFDSVNIFAAPDVTIVVDSNVVSSQTNTFYLTQNVSSISRLSVSKNGLVLTPNLHFNVTNNIVTLNTAAEINDTMLFVHQYTFGNVFSDVVLKTGDTMTGNLTVAASLITQNVVPSANITYDLGTSTKRFKDLWLSNSTIYLGNTTISANGDKLVVPALELSSGANLSNAVLKTGSAMTGQLNIVSGGLVVNSNSIFNVPALYVDWANSEVGLGTSNPTANLTVIGSTFITNSGISNPGSESVLTISSTNGDYPHIQLHENSAEFSPRSYSANNSGFVNFYGVSFGEPNFGNALDFVSGCTAERDGSIIRFLTAGSGTASVTERVRIEQNGRVGIGVTNPTSPLEVGQDEDTYLGITIRSVIDEFGSLRVISNNRNTTYAEFNGSQNEVALAAVANVPLILKTNDTTRLTITQTGNVGIGNTAPASKLTVAGTIESTSGGIKFPDGTSQASAATGAPSQNLVSGTTVTAIKDNHYILTNASATTVTLPSAPANGDIVWVTVVNNRVDNVIARNGKLLQGLSEDMTLNNQYASVQLRFINDTYGWRLL